MPGGGVRATAIHGRTGATVSGAHTEADGGTGESLVSESTHQMAQTSLGTDPAASGINKADSVARRSSSSCSCCSDGCRLLNINYYIRRAAIDHSLQHCIAQSAGRR